ncbi:MAG TPA: tetratricopeptide repeat protein [Pirellulales bacterium]|nr:tetratricopeptide repeat protein [Pirellulales bacterium]
MSAESLNVRSIFGRALDIPSEAERTAYLDEVCAAAPEIRHKVDALLNAYASAGSFLESPLIAAPSPEVTSDFPLHEGPSSQIGPYKLLQKLGEGGMGTVYMAEQEHPVRRRVALKIIQAGMNSAKVVARFDQERQALTMMDHPNIARALDAGATETGRPYFVMELVKGIPITRYCDHEHLTPAERLELFIPVCQAIQHAHQKGIIHRDIKPSNVLIALYDGRPVPKVIDFGVAKATGQTLTERTMFTEVGSIVGTLEYMAPEQAELNNLDIDTRADIYSLGVLLYELLTGSPPFTSQQLRSAAFAEMLRLIREVEPPRPSTRLSSSEELASIAALRRLEPQRLTKLVQYDLDWIVMKALEKDRGRRYETANALADDITRYLHDEPVQAGPPRAGYRLRKFLRRNKRPVLAAALVLLSLVGGIMGTTWGLVRASQALDAEAEQRHAADKLAQEKAALAEVERQSRDRADRQSELALKTLNSVVFEIASKLEGVPGAHEVRRSLLSTAIEGLKQVARTLEVAPNADHALVWSHIQLGDVFLLAGGPKSGGTEEARKQFQIARDVAEKLAHDNPKNVHAQRDLGAAYQSLGDLSLQLGNLPAAREAFDKYFSIEQKLAHDNPQDAYVQRNLAVSYSKLGELNLELGNTVAARDDFQKCLEIDRKLAHDDPQSALAQRDLSIEYGNLGNVDLELGNAAAARDVLQQSLEICQKLAHDDPQSAQAQRDLALAHERLGYANLRLGNAAAARNEYQIHLEICQKLAHDDSLSAEAQRDLSRSHINLGDVNQQLGDMSAARDAFQKGLEIRQKLAGDDPQNAVDRRNLAQSYRRLAGVNKELGNGTAAREEYQKSIEIELKLARDDPQNALVRADLTASYLNLGDLNLKLGDAATARDDYQKFFEISQKLARDDPRDAHAQHELSVSHEKFGDVELHLGNTTAARDDYQISLEIFQKLAHDDPQSTQAQTDLSWSLGHLGDFEIANENFSAATRCYAQGVAILEKLDQDGKIANQRTYQAWLAAQRKAFGSSQAAERAIDNLDFALGRPKKEIPDLLGIRSRALARQGKHAEAAATAEKLAALRPVSGENLLQAAQGYALCAGGLKPADSKGQLSADEQALQERYAARAVELLKQSNAAGHFKHSEQRAKLDLDHNLDALRSRDDFKNLLAEIPAAPDEKLPPPRVTKWAYPADEHGVPGSYEMGDSEWVEMKNGKIAARFKMTGSTANYVELYDAGRKLWVRLSQTNESFSTDHKQWHFLFKGKPVHDDVPTTGSSPSSPPATDRPKSDQQSQRSASKAE